MLKGYGTAIEASFKNIFIFPINNKEFFWLSNLTIMFHNLLNILPVTRWAFMIMIRSLLLLYNYGEKNHFYEHQITCECMYVYAYVS